MRRPRSKRARAAEARERDQENSREDSGGERDRVWREFMHLFRRLEDRPSPELTDALSESLLTVLGSGPSFATLESMLAASQADGLMYYNAVANQQRTNLLGMALTARCVNTMLRMPEASVEAESDEPPLESGGAGGES